MAVLNETSLQQSGAFQPTTLTLSASDTFTYNPGQMLVLYNATAGSLSPVIDGADGTTVSIPGAGGASFSVAAGLTVVIPAGEYRIIKLDTITAYLQGAITITTGTGIKATLLR